MPTTCFTFFLVRNANVIDFSSWLHHSGSSQSGEEEAGTRQSSQDADLGQALRRPAVLYTICTPSGLGGSALLKLKKKILRQCPIDVTSFGEETRRSGTAALKLDLHLPASKVRTSQLAPLGRTGARIESVPQSQP